MPSTQELLAEARRQLAELRAALRQEALLGERLRRSRIGRRDRDPPVAPLSEQQRRVLREYYASRPRWTGTFALGDLAPDRASDAD